MFPMPSHALIIRIQLLNVAHKSTLVPVEPLEKLSRHIHQTLRYECRILDDLDALLSDLDSVIT